MTIDATPLDGGEETGFTGAAPAPFDDIEGGSARE